MEARVRSGKRTLQNFRVPPEFADVRLPDLTLGLVS